MSIITYLIILIISLPFNITEAMAFDNFSCPVSARSSSMVFETAVSVLHVDHLCYQVIQLTKDV